MKHKISKFKRILIAAMAVVCVFSTVAIIGVSAATETFSYTIDCVALEDKEHILITQNVGEVSDTFANYPTIYDGKTSSTVQASVYYDNWKHRTMIKIVTLQKNNPSYPSVNYGAIPKGQQGHYFYVSAGGGFKDTVTTRNKY